jgi:hypothetical protein
VGVTTCQWPIFFLPPVPVTRTRAAHHGASHQSGTTFMALSLPASVLAGDHHPTWVSVINPARGSRQRNRSPFLLPLVTMSSRPSLYSFLPLPLPLLSSPSSATTVPLHHHPIGGSGLPSLSASDTGSHHSPHHHLLPRRWPLTTTLRPPPSCPRLPQAPSLSPATLRTKFLFRQPFVRTAVDHLAADCLPHHC